MLIREKKNNQYSTVCYSIHTFEHVTPSTYTATRMDDYMSQLQQTQDIFLRYEESVSSMMNIAFGYSVSDKTVRRHTIRAP